MAYGPENERSELVTPANFSDGRVFETTRRFHAASPAFISPARRPTRRSGVGAVVDMSSFAVAHAARDSARIASDRDDDAAFTVGSGGRLRACGSCGRFRWTDRRRRRRRTETPSLVLPRHASRTADSPW